MNLNLRNYNLYWKNKSIIVCNSNTLRVDNANYYVFGKVSELFSNEQIIKDIVANVNRQRTKKINLHKKEVEKLDKKKKKIFEAYEYEIITRDEFLTRKKELNNRVKVLEEKKAPLLVTVSADVSEEIPYEFIKIILENFSKVLMGSTSRE